MIAYLFFFHMVHWSFILGIKSKRQIMKLLSVDDSIFIFLSYMDHGTLVIHIGSGMAAQQ